MIVAGFDGSRDLKYVGAVFGAEGRLRRLLAVLEARYGSAHLRDLPNAATRARAAATVLSSGMPLYCLHIDLDWVIYEVRSVFPRIPKKGVLKAVARALWPYVEHLLSEHEVDLVYVCRDVEWVFRDRVSYVVGGLSVLADSVAWYNLRRPRGITASGVREVRLRERLREAAIATLRERR